MNKFRNKRKCCQSDDVACTHESQFFLPFGGEVDFLYFWCFQYVPSGSEQVPIKFQMIPKTSIICSQWFSSSPHVSFKVFMCSPRCSHSTTFYILICCCHVHFMSCEVRCHFGIWQICQVDFSSLYIAELPSPLHPMEP